MARLQLSCTQLGCIQLSCKIGLLWLWVIYAAPPLFAQAEFFAQPPTNVAVVAPQPSSSGSVSTGYSQPLGSSGGAWNPGGPGAAGGAAMADFSTLMNLIQQTIDPDSWLAAGGTSSLLPYPSGVYVDPTGQLKRIRETGGPSESGSLSSDLTLDDRAVAAGIATRHPWRTPSPLRTVSLKRLEQALVQLRAQGLRPTAELINLAGLARLEYVKIDLENEDILLAGPAGNGVPGFFLEDLAVIGALSATQTTPFGCSIEPSDAGVVAAQELFSRAGSMERLARSPAQFMQQMQQAMGPHAVKIFGMHARTGMAVALVDADAHMKQLGFGKVAAPLAIDSYFDHLDRQSTVAPQSLIRWWFAFADSAIECNSSHDLFKLPEQCVAVMSEQQWISQQGRAPTGSTDAAADAFAQGITERLPRLRAEHPAYARLNAVFESSLAFQLVLEATGQPSLQAWFPTLAAIGKLENEQLVEPTAVEGLTAWHRLKNGTVVAVVSGGVKIDPRPLAEKKHWHDSNFLASSLVPSPAARPSTGHGLWWWD